MGDPREQKDVLLLLRIPARPSVTHEDMETRKPSEGVGEQLEPLVMLLELGVSAAEVGRRLAAAQTPSLAMGGPPGGVQGGAKSG